EGFEWLYVLSGRLRLVIGERDLTLPPGEAAEFDTSLPHWLGSADGGVVELLILFGLQGVRSHVRTDPRRPSQVESRRWARSTRPGADRAGEDAPGLDAWPADLKAAEGRSY